MKRLAVLFLCAVAWIAAAPSAARAAQASAQAAGQSAQTPAQKVVASLHEALLSVMKEADALGYAGRRARLDEVIAKVYDLPTIARGSIGRAWKRLSPEQKKRLVAAMRHLTVATYAARFDGYSGESFRILSETQGPRGTVLVATELVKADGEPLRIDYLLRPTKTRGWRIVDVYLKGVYSELAIKRAEYRAVIKRKGFDGLIAAIERKAAAFAAEGRAKDEAKAES